MKEIEKKIREIEKELESKNPDVTTLQFLMSPSSLKHLKCDPFLGSDCFR